VYGAVPPVIVGVKITALPEQISGDDDARLTLKVQDWLKPKSGRIRNDKTIKQ